MKPSTRCSSNRCPGCRAFPGLQCRAVRVVGTARHAEARCGLSRGSVRLMEISSTLTRQPGVQSALVAMATAINLEMLDTLGFDAPASGPNDMLVAIVATDADALAGALDQLEQELTGAPSLVD